MIEKRWLDKRNSGYVGKIRSTGRVLLLLLLLHDARTRFPWEH
jgi:hypothetical protein